MSVGIRRAWVGTVVAAIAAAVVTLATGSAGAVVSNLSVTDQTEVRIVAAATAVGGEREIRLGLHFKMQPGWKVYWRSPGPGGFPPSIDWAGSENLANARMDFPAPVRFSVLGFETLGYKDEVVYPITATLSEPGQPLRLRAQLRYLTCSEICVPYETVLSLDLPAGPAGTSAFAHLIERFAAQVPGDGTASGLSIEKIAVDGPPEAPILQITTRAAERFSAPDIFVEGPDVFEFSAPETSISSDGLLAVLTIRGGTPAKDPKPLAGQALTVTMVDGTRSVEAVLVAEAGPNLEVPGSAALAVIIGLALLGGLILNLMPCVLPVLSIKILGAVSHGGGATGPVRLRFLATAAGIFAAFMLLAAATIAVKSAGVVVGWGIQFQQPVFLVGITLVLTLFAGNVWGLFEIRLPAVLADIGARGGRREGLAGDFLTGAFATLLATPCTAPFLGTAVGFALARGALEILLVFAALGLGLALPYLLVAARPQLVTALPAPGPWMIRLKQIMALALVATVIWLLTVLAAQAGAGAAYVTGTIMAAVLVLLWVWHRGLGRVTGPVLAGALVVLAAAAFAAPAVLRTGSTTAAIAKTDLWKPFDRAVIPALVAQGKTVFVDVTADWCITCLANKSLVLNRGAVAVRLGAESVVAMVADWTRPSKEISDYLGQYGRYGIPFNIVYGPGAPAGVPLPELLTADAVMRAFDKAAGPGARAARQE